MLPNSQKKSMFLGLLIVVVAVYYVDGKCTKTLNGNPYKLTIALLTNTDNVSAEEDIIMKKLKLSGEVRSCFGSPHYAKLNVNESLKLEKMGWTFIKHGMEQAMNQQGTLTGSRPNVIIGPFYMNIAMILERENIPYVVTESKGFDWIDMSRVEDEVKWNTMVEIRPPAKEQNLAVVDIFSIEKWTSAVMIMPGKPRDNHECQDLATQLLERGVSLIPFSVYVGSASERNTIREILRNSRLSRQKQIIVCSPRDERDRLIRKVLKEAKLYDLLSNKDQYFIFVDPSSYLQPFAGAAEMYQLGLFSVRSQLLAFRYIKPSINDTLKNAEEATSNDAARVTALALKHYLDHQRINSNDFSHERFIKALKSIHLKHGETGMIRFNSTGQRTQYRLELYKHGGEDMYKKIAEWSLKGSSPHERLSRSNKTENRNEILNRGIFPDVVKVVVVKEEPFVIEKEGRIGNDRFEGFTIDLLKLLQEKLKFHYLVYVSPLNQYGANRNGGHWDGMVGEIISKNATLAMGAISITSQREAVIDFSLGVISTGVNILVSKPDEQYTIFQFLKPFSLELWMAILGSSVVVCIMYFLLDYTRPQRKFTLKETLWFSIGTLLKRGTDFSPGPVSQRVISVGFGFFVLITVATYTANMAAFLTTTNLGKTVKSFESLAETENMACGTVNNSATMNFLKMGTKPVFRRLWEKIVETNGLVLDSQQGRDMVAQGSYAFIFDYLINTYSEGVHCETLSVSSPILIQEHGIGMIAGAPFKTSINIELLKLKKSGKIQELKKKWWDDKKQCETDQENTAKKQVQFGLKHTAGVFIMGVFGTACGVAFFLFKKFYLIAKPIEDREKEILSRESPATISRCSKSSEPTPV